MSWNKNIEAISTIMSSLETHHNGGSLQVDQGFKHWIEMTDSIQKKNQTIFFVGNGASASMASHFSADMFKNGEVNTQVFTDVGIITAISNDISYSEVYAFPISRIMKEGDMLITISSSGNSKNVVRALEECKKKGGYSVSLSAMKTDNQSKKLTDLSFFIPTKTYGMAETGHAAILHHWVDLWLNEAP